MGTVDRSTYKVEATDSPEKSCRYPWDWFQTSLTDIVRFISSLHEDRTLHNALIKRLEEPTVAVNASKYVEYNQTRVSSNDTN